MRRFTIGQLARQAEVGVETVRYYEREGLLEEPERQTSGYRQFDERAVDRIRLIRRAKELGFTLKEIKELLDLRFVPTTTCADVKSRAEAKIADIEDRISSLNRMKRSLAKVTRACGGEGPITECPILNSLSPSKQ